MSRWGNDERTSSGTSPRGSRTSSARMGHGLRPVYVRHRIGAQVHGLPVPYSPVPAGRNCILRMPGRPVVFKMVPEAGWGEVLMSYQDYLQSDHWKNIRRRKIDMVHGCCEGTVTDNSGYKWGCHRTNALEVHHLTYERLGRERLSDLMVLCPICHRHTHRLTPTRNDWRKTRWVFGWETDEAWIASQNEPTK